jgi:hypothetical protein
LFKQAVAMAAVMASTQVLAATPDNYDVTTTGDFIALCTLSPEDPSYHAAIGFCLGSTTAMKDPREIRA